MRRVTISDHFGTPWEIGAMRLHIPSVETGIQGPLLTLHEPCIFSFPLCSAMSSEQNKKLFLQQVEQILDGIKEERTMVGGGYDK